MNIAFTGTANHASISTLFETSDPNHKIVSHKILCTLNNEGKRDAYEFENLLDEFKYSRCPQDKNKLVFEVINDISDKEAQIILKQDLGNIKKEYVPNCLGVKINGKPIKAFSNNLYIFKKLQKLANEIAEIRPIDFLFQKKTIDKKEILLNMIGIEHLGGKENEVLSRCFNPENMKLNSLLVSTSLHEVIKSLLYKK